MSSSELASADGTGTMLMNMAITFMYRMGTMVVGLGAVVATVLYFKQDSMLYFPEIGGISRRPSQNPRKYRSPSEHQIPFENHKIECADGVHIHAWLMLRQGLSSANNNNNNTRLPTIIFFHGNAGNIGLRLPNALQMLQYLNVNVLMVEYRGYGDSDSVTPGEAGLKLDAEAALKFLVKHESIDSSRIFVFGRSLGGGVAFHLAQYAEQQHLPLAGVIVENTFTSIADMVDHLMPAIAPLKSLVLRIGWNSEVIVPHLSIPILYVAGGRDELVPHVLMQKLYKSTTKSRLCKLHVVPDGTHNETWMQGGQEYWLALNNFIVQALNLNSNVVAPATTDPNVFEAPLPLSSVDTSSATSSIPIMPSRILGIAQESIRSGGSTSNIDSGTGKKEL